MNLDLRELRESAAETLASVPAALVGRGVTRDDLVRDVGAMDLALHTVAAAELLVEGKPQGFFLNLSRAAENWSRLLARLAATAGAPPPASRSAAFLGAIAAADWERARSIARLAAGAFQDGEEYEDDFAWTQLLQQHVLGASPEALAKALEAVDRAGGADSYGDRADMLEAVWTGDLEAFMTGFRAAWAAHAEETERAATSPGTSSIELGPYRSLWLEGLAYLRLAEQRGLAVGAASFRYCPALARVPRTVELQPRDDAWIVRL